MGDCLIRRRYLILPPIWDGNINIEEEWINNISIPQMTFDKTSVTDSLTFNTHIPIGVALSETFTTVGIPSMEFDDTDLIDTVTITFDTP